MGRAIVRTSRVVMPAKAGIHGAVRWTPAFAGVTAQEVPVRS